MAGKSELLCPVCGQANPSSAGRCAGCNSRLAGSECSQCGRPVNTGHDLCDSCRLKAGRDSAMGPPCKACGTANPASETVCTVCGAPLRSSILPMDSGTPLPEDILLGRRRELKIMQDALEQCLSERTVVTVLITGPQGFGKSHLLESFLGRIAGKVPARRIFSVPCLEVERDSHAPFSVLLKQRLDTESRDEPVAKRLAVTGEVAKLLGSESAAVVTEVAHIAGHMAQVAFPQSPVLKSLEDHPEQLQSRYHFALTHFFKADAKNGPVVWALDDFHRTGPEQLFLFNRVVADLSDVPLLVLISGASSILDSLGELEPLVIQMEPLDDETMEELFLRNLPGLHRPPEELVTATVERAAGNPASMRELARLLVESGVVDTSQDPWAVNLERLEASDLPVTLEDALKARRQKLEPRERMVLERAAVTGEIFWDEAVIALGRSDSDVPEKIRPAHIWPDDSEVLNVESTLDRLRERGFIVSLADQDIPGRIQYAFTRAGLRDQICEEIEPERRSRYHRVAAQWLTHATGDQVDVFSEIIADHWERSGDRSRAGECYLQAAGHAQSKFLNQKAIRLFEKGLSCFGEEDREKRIQALHDLGSVFELTGNYDEALERLSEMLYEAFVLVNRGKAGAALNKIGRIYRAKGDFTAARAFLERGKSLFKAAKDIRGVAASLDDLGDLARRQGHLDRAFRQVTESLDLRRKLGDQRSIAVSLVNLGHIETARASYREASRYYEEALNIRRKIDDRAGIAISLNALAIVYYHRGLAGDAIETWEGALHIIEEVGDTRMLAVVRNNLGQTYMDEGALEQAARHLKASEELAGELDDKMLLTDLYRNLGTLAKRRGDTAAAEEYIEKSLDLARLLNIPEYEGQALRQLAELAASTIFDQEKETSGDAGDLFEKAIKVFEKIGNTSEAARTLKAYGTWLLEKGKNREGKELIEKSKSLFKQIEAREGEKPKYADKVTDSGSESAEKDIQDLTDHIKLEGTD